MSNTLDFETVQKINDMRIATLENMKNNIQEMDIEELRLFCVEIVEENQDLSKILMGAALKMEENKKLIDDLKKLTNDLKVSVIIDKRLN